MKKLKIATFSMTSVHAAPYIDSIPVHSAFDWVAASISPEDRNIPDLKRIPSYVKIYETEEELLKSHPDLDVVVLIGSNDQTYGQFKLCVKHGIKSILMMKVPSLSMEKYEEMRVLAKEENVSVLIELEMRKDQTVRRIKELLDSGVIGKLLSVQINNTTVVLPPELLPWVTDPGKSYGSVHKLREGDDRYRGGALTDHPHAFDLVRLFTGSEFESIYADVCENFRDGRQIEEGVFVLGKTKNGVNVTIDPSYSRHENKKTPIAAVGPGWEGYPKRVEVNIVLNGEKGSIMGDCFHSGVYHTGLPYNTYAVQYVGGGGTEHYSPILDALVDCTICHTVPYTNLDNHKNNMKAVNACYESIYTGETIYL